MKNPNWKEEQRKLSERARMGFVHHDTSPGKIIRYHDGKFYQVQADGSHRRFYPQAAVKGNEPAQKDH